MATSLPSKRSSAQDKKRLIHKSLVLHFLLQQTLSQDADLRCATRSMGRVHHRILYFAHSVPGITVSDLLMVLGVRHQNIQAPLRQLIEQGYVLSRASESDGRVKRLSCTRKGDKLLDFFSGGQRERVQRGFDSVTPDDIEGYFKVVNALLDSDRRELGQRLTELDEPAHALEQTEALPASAD